ncbi:hypothetical protein GCM10010266_03440 [Streptomyces griseomycini]|uniref:hypothetical protein n=1 Tax=Streptomyces griseomycini TaxID=66895 RepID=UPI0019C57C32|nr:hypothetical protein [Streptomyces griseomycini]GGP84683.1 hypothetical protein GCM10010266_03440 [Streptomyces griseomycini]
MGLPSREAGGRSARPETVSARPPPPRFETADGGRMLLRQQDRPLLLGRADTDGRCRDLSLRLLAPYRSPLPPLRSTARRPPVDRPHRYARRLEESPGVPVHDGRRHLSPRSVFAPGVRTEDLVRAWPGGSREPYCGGGRHGVLPLRRRSPPDAPRVKAYRRHAREGAPAPVPLWWVSFSTAVWSSTATTVPSPHRRRAGTRRARSRPA